MIEQMMVRLNANNLHIAVELAAAAGLIAGFGPVKMEAVKAYQTRLLSLWQTFESASGQLRAA